MNILITICARGGSKGIPGKNILNLCGKPLIAYTIEVAFEFAKLYNAKVTLSTDSEEIKLVAENYNLKSNYRRPEELSTDIAGKMSAIRDLLRFEEDISGKYDYVLDLDVTSPLRTTEDLIKSFEIIKNTDVLTLFSVNEANRNPYFNMVEKKENGNYGLVKQFSSGAVLTRQSAPSVYDLNASFYWYQRSFFDTEFSTALTDNSGIYVMPHICFDLDHQYDFDFLEYLINHNKISWFQ